LLASLEMKCMPKAIAKTLSTRGLTFKEKMDAAFERSGRDIVDARPILDRMRAEDAAKRQEEAAKRVGENPESIAQPDQDGDIATGSNDRETRANIAEGKRPGEYSADVGPGHVVVGIWPKDVD
jgi:hypothetical protein